jgi:hypothetical protein
LYRYTAAPRACELRVSPHTPARVRIVPHQRIEVEDGGWKTGLYYVEGGGWRVEVEDRGGITQWREVEHRHRLITRQVLGLISRQVLLMSGHRQTRKCPVGWRITEEAYALLYYAAALDFGRVRSRRSDQESLKRIPSLSASGF